MDSGLRTMDDGSEFASRAGVFKNLAGSLDEGQVDHTTIHAESPFPFLLMSFKGFDQLLGLGNGF